MQAVVCAGFFFIVLLIVWAVFAMGKVSQGADRHIELMEQARAERLESETYPEFGYYEEPAAPAPAKLDEADVVGHLPPASLPHDGRLPLPVPPNYEPVYKR